MKMSYRHRFPILMMVITVSVFLFLCLFLSSCGIPTYWQPKNSKNSSIITKVTSSNTNEVDFTINVEFYSGDDGSNAPNIGLLLLYVYAGDEESILDTELVKTFNSKYRGTIPYGLGTLSSNNNEALWTFTVSETDYNVYAFSPSSSNGISAWQYNNALSYTTDFTCSVSLKLNSDLDTAELYLDSVDSGVQYFGLDETNLDALKNSTYVHVYAAISAQGDKDANYSNIYWSNLTYVGSFSGFKDSTSTNSED